MSSVKNTVKDSTGKNKVEKNTLYLVAVPIGNLSDFSERALKVLSEVDFIAAEDTRNTGLLLARFGIKKPLVSYFEHNKRQRGEEIVARIENGESCALVTDAGMPAISDPGEDLVALCAERGVIVTCVPGCCAVVTALALSGLATGRFAFEGFLSTSKGERAKRLSEIKGEKRTLIFYEAPHKLRTTLDDLFETFGDRRISLCRELTKLNEEIIRTTLSSAIELYREKSPRGEYVLVMEGESKDAGIASSEEENSLLSLSIQEHVSHYEEEGLARMDAIKRAAKDRGMTKSELYKLLNS
jgi:16S rRNA (cytidine1402-2'-O)-methyltransferase